MIWPKRLVVYGAEDTVNQLQDRMSLLSEAGQKSHGKSVIWPKRLVVYGAEDTVVKTIEPIVGPHVGDGYSKNICLYIFIPKI